MALATVAAAFFAVGATVQSSAVGRAVDAHNASGATRAVGHRAMRSLLGNRDWWASIGIIVVAGVVHATALALAPISIVQPIGVLAIPLAVLISARRLHQRPPLTVMLAVAVTMMSVLAFVLAAAADGKNADRIDPAHIAISSVGIAVVAAALAGVGLLGPRWSRCVAFSTAGAIVYGLGSGLLRADTMLVVQGDLLNGPVLGYTAAVAGCYVLGGWFIQHAHANGAPAVVIGSLTVIDPIVAVLFGVAFLGEGTHLAPIHTLVMMVAGTLAAVGVILLAKHHPESDDSRTTDSSADEPLPVRRSREEHTP